ncbi:MAG TPA: porin, partial [Vicinamibacteria bacterium]|nr:porin [Vicinamibacteria bacterium]
MRAGALVLAALLPFASTAGAQGQEKEPPPGWRVEPFAIENPSAGFRLALRGYVQADFRSFPEWPAGDDDVGSLHDDEFEWQRIRIGVEGRWRRLTFEVDADPAFDEGDELKDAWLSLRLARALQVRGGRMKLPSSPERLTSPAKTDFIERADVVEAIAPDRDWGVVLHGEIGRFLEYQGGVFEGDGSTRDDRAGTT